MSNYTVTTNFGAKDTLSSGNPAKLILGAQLTTEFNNVATAIATKYDLTTTTISLSGALTANGAATFGGIVTTGNYTALISNTSTLDGDIARVLVNANGTSAGILAGNAATVSPLLTGGPTGAQVVIRALGAYPMIFGTANTVRMTLDASGSLFMAGTGSGMGVGTINATGLYVNGVAVGSGTITGAQVNTALGYTAANAAALNASSLTSGTVANARLPNIASMPGVTIQSDPGGTPSGSAGDIFFYY